MTTNNNTPAILRPYPVRRAKPNKGERYDLDALYLNAQKEHAELQVRLASYTAAATPATTAATPAPTATTTKKAGKGIPFSQEVYNLQEKLIQQGYYTGKHDGQLGDKTKLAIATRDAALADPRLKPGSDPKLNAELESLYGANARTQQGLPPLPQYIASPKIQGVSPEINNILEMSSRAKFAQNANTNSVESRRQTRMANRQNIISDQSAADKYWSDKQAGIEKQYRSTLANSGEILKNDPTIGEAIGALGSRGAARVNRDLTTALQVDLPQAVGNIGRTFRRAGTETISEIQSDFNQLSGRGMNAVTLGATNLPFDPIANLVTAGTYTGVREIKRQLGGSKETKTTTPKVEPKAIDPKILQSNEKLAGITDRARQSVEAKAATAQRAAEPSNQKLEMLKEKAAQAKTEKTSKNVEAKIKVAQAELNRKAKEAQATQAKIEASNRKLALANQIAAENKIKKEQQVAKEAQRKVASKAKVEQERKQKMAELERLRKKNEETQRRISEANKKSSSQPTQSPTTARGILKEATDIKSQVQENIRIINEENATRNRLLQERDSLINLIKQGGGKLPEGFNYGGKINYGDGGGLQKVSQISGAAAGPAALIPVAGPFISAGLGLTSAITGMIGQNQANKAAVGDQYDAMRPAGFDQNTNRYGNGLNYGGNYASGGEVLNSKSFRVEGNPGVDTNSYNVGGQQINTTEGEVVHLPNGPQQGRVISNKFTSNGVPYSDIDAKYQKSIGKAQKKDTPEDKNTLKMSKYLSEKLFEAQEKIATQLGLRGPQQGGGVNAQYGYNGDPNLPIDTSQQYPIDNEATTFSGSFKDLGLIPQLNPAPFRPLDRSVYDKTLLPPNQISPQLYQKPSPTQPNDFIYPPMSTKVQGLGAQMEPKDGSQFELKGLNSPAVKLPGFNILANGEAARREREYGADAQDRKAAVTDSAVVQGKSISELSGNTYPLPSGPDFKVTGLDESRASSPDTPEKKSKYSTGDWVAMAGNLAALGIQTANALRKPKKEKFRRDTRTIPQVNYDPDLALQRNALLENTGRRAAQDSSSFNQSRAAQQNIIANTQMQDAQTIQGLLNMQQQADMQRSQLEGQRDQFNIQLDVNEAAVNSANEASRINAWSALGQSVATGSTAFQEMEATKEYNEMMLDIFRRAYPDVSKDLAYGGSYGAVKKTATKMKKKRSKKRM